MWGAWLGATVATFAVFEARAFANKRVEHTFTWVSRRWLGINPRKPWGPFGTGVLLGACAWTAAHLATGKYGIPCARPFNAGA